MSVAFQPGCIAARTPRDFAHRRKPGALLAGVVGDQASYFRVMIRTGELLGELAASLGCEVVRRDPFRTRPATATGDQLREELVALRWPGGRQQPAPRQRRRHLAPR